MIISNRYNFIYIHIPKTGGSSINHSLKNYHDEKAGSLYYKKKYSHQTVLDLERIFGKNYDQYYSFAFVRNPWDRLVSWYMYLREHMADRLRFYFENMFPDFKAYLKFLEKYTQFFDANEYEFYDAPYNIPFPQSQFISGGDGNIHVDYIGRFEKLSDDFLSVCNTLGIQSHLRHDNRSKHRDYRAYYDSKSIDIVKDLFRKEIDILGFEFDAGLKQPIKSDRWHQLENGLESFNQHKWERAIDIYDALLSEKTRIDIERQLKLAESYEKVGKKEMALELLLKIVEVAPDNLTAWGKIMDQARRSQSNQLLVRSITHLKGIFYFQKLVHSRIWRWISTKFTGLFAKSENG